MAICYIDNFIFLLKITTNIDTVKNQLVTIGIDLEEECTVYME